MTSWNGATEEDYSKYAPIGNLSFSDLRTRVYNTTGPFGAVMAALEIGSSAVVMLTGDSTGNDLGEWPDLVVRDIGKAIPSCRVQVKTYDDALGRNSAWNVIQPGALGERYAYVPPTIGRTLSTPNAEISAVTGDIDIRVKLAPESWTPAGLSTIIGRYGAAGARSWTLSLNPTGTRLQFDWSTDGTNSFAVAPPPNLPVFTANQTKWVRFTLDVDNGAGGYTATCYVSDDGITWTQVGQTVTSAGITSIYGGGTQDYELGGRGITAQLLPGKFFEAQIRNGIDGPIVNPQPIDSWLRVISSDTLNVEAFGGSGTLYVINGSIPGADLTYLSDATRMPKMFAPYPSALMFLSCSHNDREFVGTSYLNRWDTFITALRARVGNNTVFCVITQNPQIAPIDPSIRANNERRRRERMLWAARNGFYTIDTYKAFIDDPRGVANLLKVDGIHPTSDPVDTTAKTGSRLWADTVFAAFRARN
jgi:hypothetical protein